VLSNREAIRQRRPVRIGEVDSGGWLGSYAFARMIDDGEAAFIVP